MAVGLRFRDAREAQVIQHLLAEWQKPLRLTTVAQAMASLGLPDDDDLRWRVAQRLRGLWRRVVRDPRRYVQFRQEVGLPVDEATIERFVQQACQWHPLSIILDEEEKLVARFLLTLWQKERRLPTRAEVGQAVRIDLTKVDRAFGMLERIGLLAREDGVYHLRRGYQRFLGGLGLTFHTVVLPTGERFNVPCAIDYLLLAGRTYRGHRVVLEDACHHCWERIRIVMEEGQVVEAVPEEPIVYRGGT